MTNVLLTNKPVVEACTPLAYFCGAVYDWVNHDSRMRYPLENNTVPTLVISPIDDGTFPGARYTAENIPGAKFIALESGGHLLVGQEEKVQSEVADFLKQHAIAG